MAQTVIGIFDNMNEAQNAVQQLVSNGFTRDYIDISAQNTSADRYDDDRDNDSVGDKIGNFFGSMFDNKDDARNYSRAARRGTVVTVHAQSSQEAERAADILDQYGAVDVNERASQYGNMSNTGAIDNTRTNNDTSIPIIEEQLKVGKQVVETGGVRLRSRILERPVEETLRLREEHLNVERHAVNRPVTEADLATFKEGTIEVTEHTEVPVVTKEARIVEEVSLSKEVEERQETIRDTVRRTEVDVENIKGESLQNDADVYGQRQGILDRQKTETDSTFLEKSHHDWTGALRRMKDVEDDYKVADEDSDVRGWDVVGRNGEKLGEVDELIVDTSARKVRYLDIDLDNSLLNTNAGHHILLPIGAATLDRENKNIMVPTLDSQVAANLPAYSGEAITRDYEHTVLTAFSPDYQADNASADRFYEREHFDTDRFYGSSRS